MIQTQATLRSKYIAPTAIYTACVNCKNPFLHGANHWQAGKPTKSKYPYCMNCLQRNAQDPGFVKWLKKLFNIKDN